MSSPLWEGVREGCGSCIFGKRLEWSAPDRVVVRIECRRYPPQMVATTERSAYDTLSHDVQQFSPTMCKDDWCGEWKRKT